MSKTPLLDRELALTVAWRKSLEAGGAEQDDSSDPVAWASRVSGLTLDDWQQDVLRSTDQKQLLLCGRQTGKSTVVSLRAADIVRQGGKVLSIAPTQRQSAIIFTAMSEALAADPKVEVVRSTQTMIETADGGVGMCLPGDRPSGIRGLTLRHAGRSAMMIDEVAFIRPGLLSALSPMLAAAPDAEQLWLSTPSGPSGPFHDAWVNDPDWTKTRITSEQCSRISPEFLASERRRLGDDMFRQEYQCEFVSVTNAFFSAELIAGIFGDDDGDAGDVFQEVG